MLRRLYSLRTAWVAITLCQSQVWSCSIFLLERQHLPLYRGPSTDLRSKWVFWPLSCPLSKSSRKGSGLARFRSAPGGPVLPRSFCGFSFSLSLPNFLPIFFSLVRSERKLHLWRGCGYPAVDVSSWRPNSKWILGSKASQSGGWSHWLK